MTLAGPCTCCRLGAVRALLEGVAWVEPRLCQPCGQAQARIAARVLPFVAVALAGPVIGAVAVVAAILTGPMP